METSYGGEETKRSAKWKRRNTGRTRVSDSVRRGPCVGKLGPEEAIYHTRTRPPKKREMDGRERAKETNTWEIELHTFDDPRREILF